MKLQVHIGPTDMQRQKRKIKKKKKKNPRTSRH
jgi:hypothetical protein